MINKDEALKDYRLETGSIRNEDNTGNVGNWVMLTHIENGKRYFGIDATQLKAKENAVNLIKQTQSLDSLRDEIIEELEKQFKGWYTNDGVFKFTNNEIYYEQTGTYGRKIKHQIYQCRISERTPIYANDRLTNKILNLITSYFMRLKESE